MLFTLGHGQKKVLSKDTAPGELSGLAPSARIDAVSYAQTTAKASSTVPTAAMAMPQGGAMPGGPFGYPFPDAPVSSTDGSTLAKLDALDDATLEAANDPPQAGNATPPVLSYLGQFIDHDITASTDREGTQSIMKRPASQTLDPLSRKGVTASSLNLRKGSLGLDSLYGDGLDDGQATTKQKDAHRNLHRGHRLKVPSAQACVDVFNTGSYGGITPLTTAELASGETGQAVAGGGFAHETPLWFYILRQAQVQAQGAHPGQLGSRIVTETLMGLTNCDQTSYWHQSGSDNGRWHPQDGAQPDGIVVDDIPAMIRATHWM